MRRYSIIPLIIFLVLICIEGICSDSAYISIRWNGPTDKPYHEFVFYKKGGYNPEQEFNSYGGSPFISQIALSENEFTELKQILFAEYHNPDSSKRSDPLFMSYYIGYFEGSNWLVTNYMNKNDDFVKTSIGVIEFFKGTKYEANVKSRWKMIFDRIGIKPN
jgi:hypothetical protein